MRGEHRGQGQGSAGAEKISRTVRMQKGGAEGSSFRSASFCPPEWLSPRLPGAGRKSMGGRFPKGSIYPIGEMPGTAAMLPARLRAAGRRGNPVQRPYTEAGRPPSPPEAVKLPPFTGGFDLDAFAWLYSGKREGIRRNTRESGGRPSSQSGRTAAGSEKDRAVIRGIRLSAGSTGSSRGFPHFCTPRNASRPPG